LGGGGGQETNVRAEAPRAERSASGRARQSAHALRRHRAGFLGAVARLRERGARGLRRLRGAFAGLRRLGVFRVHRAHRRGVLVSRLGILPIVPGKANGRNRGESRRARAAGASTSQTVRADAALRAQGTPRLRRQAFRSSVPRVRGLGAGLVPASLVGTWSQRWQGWRCYRRAARELGFATQSPLPLYRFGWGLRRGRAQ